MSTAATMPAAIMSARMLASSEREVSTGVDALRETYLGWCDWGQDEYTARAISEAEQPNCNITE